MAHGGRRSLDQATPRRVPRKIASHMTIVVAFKHLGPSSTAVAGYATRPGRPAETVDGVRQIKM